MLIDAGLFVARLLVGGVLLVAGLAKIRSGSNQFLKAIIGYDLLPNPIATVVARVLPWLEALAGALLIVGLWTYIATFLGMGLLMVFSSAVAVSLLRGKRQDCGCFQSLKPVQWQLVYRNLRLMTLLLPVSGLRGGSWSVDHFLTPPDPSKFHISAEWIALTIAWALFFVVAMFLQWSTRQRAMRAASSD